VNSTTTLSFCKGQGSNNLLVFRWLLTRGRDDEALVAIATLREGLTTDDEIQVEFNELKQTYDARALHRTTYNACLFV
jgi:hypothetical protein